MNGRFPAAWIEEVRSRNDIVQTISGYVPLKKKGKKYWGLCPFHGEKTASFSVDAENQSFYCFGCKAGGTVFGFIMQMEHLTFPEAAEQLAERARIPLPQMMDEAEYERRKTLRERLCGANREAARFYHDTLYTPAGEAALRYLKGRGLSDGVIRKFGIGAAPDSWDALTRYLKEKGYTEEELEMAGLCVIKSAEPAIGENPGRPRRVFDMFRNRAMFPIIDEHGNVLAFGGRILGKGEPKYLNTSDTPVFNKRKGVFAANLLRKERHLDRVILVEGYMDVVSLTQFGIRGVVATLGTSLTEEQARLLKRYAPQVYLSYDGDAAGQHAILRGLDIFGKEGIPVRVLDFPDGLDPDEFIRRDGPEAFAKLPALTPETYRIRRLQAEADFSTDQGKAAFARKAVAVLTNLDPVEREGYLKQLTIETGFSRDVLNAQMAEELRKAGRAVPKQTSGHRSDPAEAMGITGGEDSAGRRAGAGKPPMGEKEWKVLRAQEVLIGLVATGLLPEVVAEEEDFEGSGLKILYQDLKAGMKPAAIIDQSEDEEDRARLTRLLMTPEASGTDEMIVMAQDCVKQIRLGRLELEMQEKEKQLANCNGEADQMKVLTEYQQLSEKKRAMMKADTQSRPIR